MHERALRAITITLLAACAGCGPPALLEGSLA